MGQCWAPGASQWGTVLLQGLEVGVSRLGGGRWGGEENSQPRGKKVQPPLAFVRPSEVDPSWAPIGRLPGFERQVGRQAGALGSAWAGHAPGICRHLPRLAWVGRGGVEVRDHGRSGCAAAA